MTKGPVGGDHERVILFVVTLTTERLCTGPGGADGVTMTEAPTSSNPTSNPTTLPTEACHGLEVLGAPPEMNGIYHKLSTNLNGRSQWVSRFRGGLDTYTLYFDTKTYNEWTISGRSGTLVLQGLDLFFEPVVKLSTAVMGSRPFQVQITCHDVNKMKNSPQTVLCFCSFPDRTSNHFTNVEANVKSHNKVRLLLMVLQIQPFQ